MDQLLKTKQKTHRSCFRKVFLYFVSKEKILEKVAQELIEEYPELINACQGFKYLLIYKLQVKIKLCICFLEYISKHYSDFDDKEARRTLRELHHELNRKA